jgi:hypothetical protein
VALRQSPNADLNIRWISYISSPEAFTDTPPLRLNHRRRP